MDAATLALAKTASSYSSAQAYNAAVPSPKTDDTAQSDDTSDSTNFQDMVAANLKDEQAAAQQQQTDDADDAATRAANRSADKDAAKNADKAAKAAKSDDSRKADKKSASNSQAQSSATSSTTATAATTQSTTGAAANTALNQQVATLVNNVFGTKNATTGQPALTPDARKKLTQTIDTMLAGLPADQRQAALTALQTTLTQNGAAGLTTTGTAAAQSGAGALIAAGLTPQQLTDLATKLNNLLGGAAGGSAIGAAAAPGGQAAGAIDDVDGELAENGAAEGGETDQTEVEIVTLPPTVQLTAPALKRDPIFTLRPTPSATTASAVKSTATDTTAAAKAAVKAASADQTAQLNALTSADPSTAGTRGDRAAHPYDNIMQIFAQSQNGGTAAATTTTAATATAAASAAAKSAATAQLAAAAADAAQTANTLGTTDQAAAQTYPDGSAWASQAGALGIVQSSAVGTPINGAAVMTSLVNNAVAAGNPHPAMQAVASAVLEAGDEGEDSNITVSLDPAELGKVQVRLQIGKDQSVKAHLLVEKPETYMMLQRDQHVLQRTLQNSGLDANNSSLSFELSQGGMNFSQDNREGNASNGGTGSSTGQNDQVGTVLETTMTWQFDPQSGQTHYNILA